MRLDSGVRFIGRDGSVELLHMPALMPEVVLNHKAQRNRRVVADFAHRIQPLCGNMIYRGRQNRVLHLPPMQQGSCRRSRGCTDIGAADRRLVVEATMGSFIVVVVVPGQQVLISFV